MSFSELNLAPLLLKTLQELKFTGATAIQKMCIPTLLRGDDVVIQAQTGSGKTATFVLPLLHQLNLKFINEIQVVVLAPTRELALQISDEFKSLGRHLQPKQNTLPLIGGENIEQQINSLKLQRQIVVATPGRLLELLTLKIIHLDQVKYLVFDEADKILNLGFAGEINQILNLLPKNKKRQNIFVSATFPEKLKNLVEKVSQNFEHLKIESAEAAPAEISHRAILVQPENKGPLLRHLITEEKWELAIVFVASKKAAENVAAKLRKVHIDAAAFHGDLTQEERTLIFKRFNSKKIKILVATDLVARGVDIDDLTHVVNYDLPRSPQDYIHRIGRTGRAGKKGHAISFITADMATHFKLIEKKSKISVPREEILDF